MNEHDGSTLISNNRMIQLHIEKSNSDYDPSQKRYTRSQIIQQIKTQFL